MKNRALPDKSCPHCHQLGGIRLHEESGALLWRCLYCGWRHQEMVGEVFYRIPGLPSPFEPDLGHHSTPGGRS